MSSTILALDVGQKRVGIARANTIARIPEPLVTLANDENFKNSLTDLINEHDVNEIVVGLPRNMKGEETDQTKYTKDFIASLKLKQTVHFQDETLTSVHAVELLESGRQRYGKENIDSLAATLILEDYLKEN